MSTPLAQLDQTALGLLEEVVGYLNFSSGARDAKFLKNLNALFRLAEEHGGEESEPTRLLFDWLGERIEQLPSESAAFGDVSQARDVVGLLSDHLLPAYRKFHRDLLWHQADRDLWRPLFVGRAAEALLAQGPPWDEMERIIKGAIEALNDYIGYRPIAVLESDRQMEPYAHEWVAPIPLYLEKVGVAAGRYEPLIEKALAILADTAPDILQQAWFDPQLLTDLALDPRAYEFDHPASQRPNHHFGQWDPNSVDNRGFYRRFVLQQITLDSLLARVTGQGVASDSTLPDHDALLLEAAAVLAGTILMASGITGNGPGCHSSDVTLSNLIPHIAAYRDQFYEQLLAKMKGPHGDRLRAEARRDYPAAGARQPFGGARQHLNHELARRRATQMQHVHLAQLYARMGYPHAALAEAHTVRTASARMLCQVYCRLTSGHQAIDARQLQPVADALPEIEDLLQRGIECGALVDPWNILGFGGNFSLFPALENTVHDFRVDELIELVEQILDLCARAWTEAAAIDDPRYETLFSSFLARLAGWWDQYATAEVGGVERLVGKEIEVSTNLVAGALSAWKKAGSEAGNVRFWRMFVDQFDSPKAFQLVIEALLDRGDRVASMALLLQWLSEAERIPLKEGDVSFHPLALRWLRSVEQYERESGADQWPLVARFFARLEASAETFWHVPEFELADARRPRAGSVSSEEDELAERLDDDSWDDLQEPSLHDEPEDLFSAAYEDMVYRDSTDDGLDADVIDESTGDTDLELEQEAQRLAQRLEFLCTVAQLWRHAAIARGADTSDDRRDLLAGWHQQAASRYAQLLELLEAVHQFPLAQPRGSHQSMVEFDRQRTIKESLQDEILATCVQTADAGRLLGAAAGQDGNAFAAGPRYRNAQAANDVLAAVLVGDRQAVRRHWPAFTQWLGRQELLFVPLARGGRPRRTVQARSIGQMVHDLSGWLPRLGLVREACQLLHLAQEMEIEHPVGPGAVTEFDRLFACGYRAIVRCLVVSSETWGRERSTEQGAGSEESPLPDPYSSSKSRRGRLSAAEADTMLVETLQDLTEAQLRRWLTHSRSLRLSSVERLAADDQWQPFVAFVERYGADLFTQKFLSLGNLRAILHQRATVWLSNLEQDPEFEELRLVQELGTNISREEAAKWLTIAIEAVVESYREYRDYNTTTTHSDHGELLYTLVDFLRLRADYDRVAWNLRPVVMAHEILVRQGRSAAAELWQQALAERTAEAADDQLARYEKLSDHYGIRLATVADRLGERFIRPLAIDGVRALVGPAIEAAGSDCDAPFAALRQEIAALTEEPAGAGLDLPDWLEALEEEVTHVRCLRRHHQPDESELLRIEQVRLTWDEWRREMGVGEG